MQEIPLKTLLFALFIIEGALIVLAFVLAYFFNVDIISAISLNIRDTLIALVATAFLAGINYLSIFVLSKYLTFFRQLRVAYDEISIIVKNVNTPGIILIALLSGITEEIFFRGFLQQATGIVVASVAFGMVHIGNRKTIYYGIYAIFIGFYLGGLFIYTANLWTPIVVHVLNNAIAIPFMKWHYKKINNQKPMPENSSETPVQNK
jgi:hypothetical protein